MSLPIVQIIYNDVIYNLPVSAREHNLFDYISNCPKSDFVIKKPSKKTDYWYLAPFSGKTFLSNLNPDLFVDGDLFFKGANHIESLPDCGRKIFLCNRLDEQIPYHFYGFISPELTLKYFEKSSDKINALLRIRTVSYGYTVLSHIANVGVNCHIFCLTENSIVSKNLMTNVVKLDVTCYDKKILLNPEVFW